MKTIKICDDIYVFVGPYYQSVSTAFIFDKKVILVDCFANTSDAMELKAYIEQWLGLTVCYVVATHYLSDHLAGLNVFPDAVVIAHSNHMQTFLGQRRNSEMTANFRKPDLSFETELSLRWGRHDLQMFHNPGHTLSTIAVDVPTADLIITGDNMVGNIVYVSSAAPSMVRQAIRRIVRRRRGTIIPGHIGPFPGTAADNALVYLERLEHAVREARCDTEHRVDEQIRDISIEACLAEGVTPTDFERDWHLYGLDKIIERDLFVAADF
jgi:cyclase